MRDPEIVLKGWPANEWNRRGLKVGFWHSDWAARNREKVEFRPETRSVPDSDYNQHYVDIESSLKAEISFDSRAAEIGYRPPDGIGRLPLPTGPERLRGAIISAAAGDAFASSCDVVKTYPWYLRGTGVSDSGLVDYLPGTSAGPTWITQMMAFCAEGLLRALGGRRNGSLVDPVSAVQHGFQRWLYYMVWDTEDPQTQYEWRRYGGIYAADAGEYDQPDGVLAQVVELTVDRRPPLVIVDTLVDFAATGVRSTTVDPRSEARGGDVLVRAALAAVWSEDVSETFDLAVAIAALTHPHPDDFLAAGAMAVVVHQLIRDQPFRKSLETAYFEVQRRPDHEKTRLMMNRSVILAREEKVPAPLQTVQRYFPGLGEDGAEAFGLALYCAISGDYLREALLLAVNYASDRCAVAATAGLLMGAEYGIKAVPKVFRDPLSSVDALDDLAGDLATELRDVLTDKEWLRRYPPT